MNPLREISDDIDEKITLGKDLSIVFTHDKGKFLARVRPEIATDENGKEYLLRYVKEGAEGVASVNAPMVNQEPEVADEAPALGKRPAPEG